MFFDGKPLLQVASNPLAGQFAVDSSRNVILAQDPTGHTVEVSTRTRWVITKSDNVTIQGFRMKHAANDTQTGALSNGGYGDFANWTVRDSVLSDAHGAVVALWTTSGLRLLDNDISRGGQEGVVGWKTTGALIRGNRIHDNNTEDFDPSWEAGGLKMSAETNLTVEGNDAYDNDGPGLWCDIDCRGVVIANNRVYDNTKAGIIYEISSYGKIYGNMAWRNGSDSPAWGVGAGVLCDTCTHTEIFGNTVAWNANGITVLSQDRGGRQVVENNVHDNHIISDRLQAYSTALGWNENWAGPLFSPSSNNRGRSNTYWFPNPEGAAARFSWKTYWWYLSEFNATPGDDAGVYLSSAEKDSILSRAGIPLSP